MSDGQKAAKTAAAATAATNTTVAKPEAPKPPKGFVMGGTPDIDGWYEPRINEVLYGQICGAIKIADEKSKSGFRDVVLVRLIEPIKAVQDKTPVDLEAGQVVGVGIRHQLADMLYYVESRGKVWALAKEKVSIGGGQTMWKFDIAFDGEKRVPPERIETAVRTPAGGIPF